MDKILIGLHEFDGPYSILAKLAHEAGLLAILHNYEGEFELVEVTASDDVNVLWTESSGRYLLQEFPGEIRVAVCYMPGLSAAERERALHEIDEEFEMVSLAA